MFTNNKFTKSLEFCSIILCILFLLFSNSSAEGTEGVKEYTIGPGDELNINVWKEEDLNLESAKVRIDGKITLPLLGDINVDGLSTMEIKAEIEKELKKYVESPTVTVTVVSSDSKKFYILGEVEQTGEYPITKNLTVMQAFAIAGGFTEWASKKEIILLRTEKGTKKTIKIDYRDIVKGDFSKNILIQADDTIVVP